MKTEPCFNCGAAAHVLVGGNLWCEHCSTGTDIGKINDRIAELPKIIKPIEDHYNHIEDQLRELRKQRDLIEKELFDYHEELHKCKQYIGGYDD